MRFFGLWPPLWVQYFFLSMWNTRTLTRFRLIAFSVHPGEWSYHPMLVALFSVASNLCVVSSCFARTERICFNGFFLNNNASKNYHCFISFGVQAKQLLVSFDFPDRNSYHFFRLMNNRAIRKNEASPCEMNFSFSVISCLFRPIDPMLLKKTNHRPDLTSTSQ